jgi:hypothetical protein
MEASVSFQEFPGGTEEKTENNSIEIAGFWVEM